MTRTTITRSILYVFGGLLAICSVLLSGSPSAAQTAAQLYPQLEAAIQRNVQAELSNLPADVARQIQGIDPATITAAVQSATASALGTAAGDLRGDAAGAIRDLANSNQITNAAAGAAQQIIQGTVQKSINDAVLQTVGITNVNAQVASTAQQLSDQLNTQMTGTLGRGLSSLTAAQRQAVDQYITGQAQSIVGSQVRSLTGIMPVFDNPVPGFTSSVLSGASAVFDSGFTDALGVTADQLNSLNLGGTIGAVAGTTGAALMDNVTGALSGFGLDPSVLSTLTPGEITSILSNQLPASVTDLLGGIDYEALLQTPQMLGAISSGIITGLQDKATAVLGAVTGDIAAAISDVAGGLTAAVGNSLADITGGVGAALTGSLSAATPAAAEALASISDFFPEDLLDALGGSYAGYVAALGGVLDFGLPLLLEYDYTSTAEEDRRYTELCIDNVVDDLNAELGIGMEVTGTRPQDCMPPKTTRLFSALELSPWYLISLQDQAGLGKPYMGEVYRGAGNMYRFANRMIQTQPIPVEGQPVPVDTATNTCRTIIAGTKQSPTDPIAVRKELDSCTNQYILTRSDLPRIPSDDLGKKLELQTTGASYCQALRMQLMNGPREMEYYPDYYFVAAWQKLLSNPSYLVPGAGPKPTEPYYAGLVGAGNIIDPIQVRDDYGKVSINDLTEFQYERIYDPSHPFSPRWDFYTNEVDAFSPIATSSYGAPRNNVYCSGFPTEGIKTDIISWRYPGYAFYMNWRIAFNAICLDSEYCREAFNCSPDEPCCAVNYEQEDRAPSIFCGPPSIQKLCAHITKPVVPVNVLKMREINEDNFTPEVGVQKAYRFDTYFGKNRPYMRCWDTGLECGADSPEIDQDSTAGSNYAIVGAGREGEYCSVGGGLGRTTSDFGRKTDPIMDWMELKLYQVRGSREIGINCIPMHEKYMKMGTGEEMVLSRTGAQFQVAWAEMGVADAAQNRLKTMNWPFSWRGYVSDPYETRFPFFMSGGGTAPLTTNLDQAEVGEVLIYDEDVVMKGIKDQSGDDRANATAAPSNVWRNPYVGFVTGIHNIKAYGGKEPENPDFIKSIAFNHGKHLDVCGNTEYWGQGEEYTIYKAELPAKNRQMLDALNPQRPTDTCEDPYMSFCIEQEWDNVKRYTPYRDRRVRSIVSGGAP